MRNQPSASPPNQIGTIEFPINQGKNKANLTYIDNVVDAHLCAERALDRSENNPGGNAYFISNDEPVNIWKWMNELLEKNAIPKIERSISLPTAHRIGTVLESVWRFLSLSGEPPMTRFVASELAKDHYFDISAAKQDLGYTPKVSMAEGMKRV